MLGIEENTHKDSQPCTENHLNPMSAHHSFAVKNPEYPLDSPLAFHAQGVCVYDGITNTGKLPSKNLQVSLHCSHTDLLQDRLAGTRLVRILSLLTGIYPSAVYVKKHNAYFGLRKDDAFGFELSLKGEEAHHFLYRVNSVFLPNDPTFQGLSTSAVSQTGMVSFVLDTLALCAELEVLKPLVEEGCVLQLSVWIPNTSKEECIRYLTERQFPFLAEKAQS